MRSAECFALLRRLVDDGGGFVTADEAKALTQLCWEARGDVVRERSAAASARRHGEGLDRENADLVAQILTEERRRMVADLALATARQLLAVAISDADDRRRFNPRGFRATVEDFLHSCHGGPDRLVGAGAAGYIPPPNDTARSETGLAAGDPAAALCLQPDRPAELAAPKGSRPHARAGRANGEPRHGARAFRSRRR